jgi:hypothetical protein
VKHIFVVSYFPVVPGGKGGRGGTSPDLAKIKEGNPNERIDVEDILFKDITNK